jgi:DNA-binding response OmpR family regulator
MHKILCVEDADDNLLILQVMLKGYEVVIARSVKEAKEILQRESFSLILLDLGLPDGDGLEIMAELLSATQATPVIVLTGKTDFESKLDAFTLGADDFIVKPFDPKEVRLRIDSKLRKLSTQVQQQESIRVGNLNCQIAEQRIFSLGSKEPIDLTSLEFRLFYLMARTPDKVFSRAEILERVWGTAISVTERTVDVHISNLRKKLEGTDVGIEAVVGLGYRILLRTSGR